jgi:hypothetical protein
MDHITTDVVDAQDGHAAGILFLDLAGPLRLRDATGVDLTPRARKAQGLLALLGTSPGLRRSRTWLQDKLWSDRGQQQGASSLRQCLTEIRAALGRHVDCLKADRSWVALDSARVRVRVEPPEPDLGEDIEFLEGLDVRDPEFEHWVRDQRMLHAARHDRGVSRAVAAPSEPRHPASAWRPVQPITGLAARAETESATNDLDSLTSLLGHAVIEAIEFLLRQMASSRTLNSDDPNATSGLELLYRLVCDTDLIRSRHFLSPPQTFAVVGELEKHLRATLDSRNEWIGGRELR